jgi:hypothetical protein
MFAPVHDASWRVITNMSPVPTVPHSCGFAARLGDGQKSSAKAIATSSGIALDTGAGRSRFSQVR